MKKLVYTLSFFILFCYNIYKAKIGDTMNRKGQALVEFIIIMPIFIFIVLAMFDLGNIIIKKYQLENDLDTVVNMYEEAKTEQVEYYVKTIDAKVKYDVSENYNVITLSKKVNVITPVVRQALGKSYEISVKRTVMKNENKQ